DADAACGESRCQAAGAGIKLAIAEALGAMDDGHVVGVDGGGTLEKWQRGERLIVGGALLKVPRVGVGRHDATLKWGWGRNPVASGIGPRPAKEAGAGRRRHMLQIRHIQSRCGKQLDLVVDEYRPIPRRWVRLARLAERLRQGAMRQAIWEPWQVAPPTSLGEGFEGDSARPHRRLPGLYFAFGLLAGGAMGLALLFVLPAGTPTESRVPGLELASPKAAGARVLDASALLPAIEVAIPHHARESAAFPLRVSGAEDLNAVRVVL